MVAWTLSDKHDQPGQAESVVRENGNDQNGVRGWMGGNPGADRLTIDFEKADVSLILGAGLPDSRWLDGMILAALPGASQDGGITVPGSSPGYPQGTVSP